MFNKIELQERLLIEDERAYAYCDELNSRRQIDGCQLLQELGQEIEEKNKELEALNEKLQKVKDDLVILESTSAMLQNSGFCTKDEAIYKRIDGILVDTGKVGHCAHCRHKED